MLKSLVKAMRRQKKGTKSIEHLHHFQCAACQKWWSIGDAPDRKKWFCPWCGTEQEFENHE